jgi:high affinity sulfate transporter 1
MRADGGRIARVVPLFEQFGSYQRAWLRSDVLAGLSVAAVGLPAAIAYPAIANLPVEMGIYSAIIPIVAYAFFGPSRQLMIGPDTATTIVLGSALLQLGVIGEADRMTAAAFLAFLTGLLSVLAGFARFGFVANFLSRPVLVGFLAGVAISLLVGQIGRLTGVRIEADGLIRPLLELARETSEIVPQTLMLGIGLFVLLRVLRSIAPRLPGALVAIVLGVAIAYGADLPSHGVAVVGAVQASTPTLGLEWPTGMAIGDLLLAAMSIMVVSSASGIVTARSFGAKHRYPVDADRELVGFGAANVASGLFGGFAVTSSDSRTAVNSAVGGKTQITALVAAATLAAAFFLLGDVLAYLPAAVLGAVLASAAVDLVDFGAFSFLWRISRVEFLLAVVTACGVVIFGVLPGVALAVGGTLTHLLWLASQPRDAMLGRIPDRDGLYKLHAHPNAKPLPGLVIYLVQAGVVFFNADYVKQRILAAVDGQPVEPSWFILDASAINHIDVTAVNALEDVHATLARRGIALGIADLHSRPRAMIERSGLGARIGADMIFDSAEAAVAAYEAGRRPRIVAEVLT